LETVLASAKKNTVAAIIAIEIIQKEIATPSSGCRKASAGLATGCEVDIGAPMALDDLEYDAKKDLCL
jgi:hypothetical protein